MRDFIQFYRRAFAVALGGARWWRSVVLGGVAASSWIAPALGYQIVWGVPTPLIGAIVFAVFLLLGLVWGAYVVFAEEKLRADQAEATRLRKEQYQEHANVLARFVYAGTELLNADAAAADWVSRYFDWDNDLRRWTKYNLPDAEYLQI